MWLINTACVAQLRSWCKSAFILVNSTCNRYRCDGISVVDWFIYKAITHSVVNDAINHAQSCSKCNDYTKCIYCRSAKFILQSNVEQCTMLTFFSVVHLFQQEAMHLSRASCICLEQCKTRLYSIKISLELHTQHLVERKIHPSGGSGGMKQNLLLDYDSAVYSFVCQFALYLYAHCTCSFEWYVFKCDTEGLIYVFQQQMKVGLPIVCRYQGNMKAVIEMLDGLKLILRVFKKMAPFCPCNRVCDKNQIDHR